MKAIAYLIVAGLVTGCNASSQSEPSVPAPAREPATVAKPEGAPALRLTGVRGATAADTVVAVSDPHAKHATFGLECETCHAGGGGCFEFAPVTFGPVMTTVGGVMEKTATTTTCTVSCHGPNPIAWDAGSLSCTDCHTGLFVANAASSHVLSPFDPVTARGECEGCHAMNSHGSGVATLTTGEGVRVSATDPAQIDEFCASCHDGSGRLLGDRVPPPVIAFWNPSGDPHGVAGTTPKLGCTRCHSAHASPQSWLIAATIDGTSTTAMGLQPNGVGAEATCVACHPAPRHQASGCLTQCHDPHGLGLTIGHSPSAPPVPNTYGCFYCHGHDGIQHFRSPANTCNHCHSNSMWWINGRPTESVPPIITGPSVASGLTTATVTWTTNEGGDSWAAYALGSSVQWAGSAREDSSHSVALSGLQTGKAYQVAVRSADAFENASTSQWFTYTAGGPGVAMLFDRTDLSVTTTAASVVLTWRAVTSPSALALTYVIEVDDSTAFDSLVATKTLSSGTRTSVTLPSGATYYWRVRVRDTQGWESISASDAFKVTKL
jgi:hypothetical protein